MNTPNNDSRMSAGIASISAHARAQAERERLDAEKAAAVPAPPAIANRPGRAERAAAEQVRCPFCKVAPGRHCEGAHQRVMTKPHPSRGEAYAVQAVACPECRAGAGSACVQPGAAYRRVVHAGRVEAVFAAGRQS